MSSTENDIPWFKSRRSDSGGGGCVETALISGMIHIRDTKQNGQGPTLIFTKPEMAAFLSGAKGGEFDKLVD